MAAIDTGPCALLPSRSLTSLLLSLQVWLRYCQFKLGGQHPEAGQRVLDRALEAVPKRKHVKLISKVVCVCVCARAHMRRQLIFLCISMFWW